MFLTDFDHGDLFLTLANWILKILAGQDIIVPVFSLPLSACNCKWRFHVLISLFLLGSLSSDDERATSANLTISRSSNDLGLGSIAIRHARVRLRIRFMGRPAMLLLKQHSSRAYYAWLSPPRAELQILAAIEACRDSEGSPSGLDPSSRVFRGKHAWTESPLSCAICSISSPLCLGDARARSMQCIGRHASQFQWSFPSHKPPGGAHRAVPGGDRRQD